MFQAKALTGQQPAAVCASFLHRNQARREECAGARGPVNVCAALCQLHSQGLDRYDARALGA